MEKINVQKLNEYFNVFGDNYIFFEEDPDCMSKSNIEPVNVGEYLVKFPDGKTVEIKNLTKFCDNYNLNVGHIHETLYGKRLHHRHFKLIPRTEEEIKRYKDERSIREDTSRKGLPGEKNGRAILDWNKVNTIRKLHAKKKYKNQEIADMFGIKKVTLEKIVANKLWTV